MALRRIQKEIEDIKETVWWAKFDKKEYKLKFVDKNLKYFIIEMPIDYPFRPPKNLVVDDKEIFYHRLANKLTINKFFDIKCICCKSILCEFNWNPSKTVKDVVKEYYKFEEISTKSDVIDFLIKKKSIPEEIIKCILEYTS